jgi:hypothetical protein
MTQKKKKEAPPKRVSLRAIDQETTRVVALLGRKGAFVGAGCLVDGGNILTCYHVVAAAMGRKPKLGANVWVKLIGIAGSKPVRATVKKWAKPHGKLRLPVSDVALLKLAKKLDIPAAEFASPLRHSGKRYSVLGFPDGVQQGRHASGILHAMDAGGLVQMDGSSSLFVKGGFSGAPVWSPDLGAFVGLVVTELYDSHMAWCIPSRVLCDFFPRLPVYFRMPTDDRPVIHDQWEDDPNLEIFGTSSRNNGRRLTAKITKKKTKQGKKYFEVTATYKCLKRSSRGKYVTFITYPDFVQEGADAYELFAELKNGKAKMVFWPKNGFTMAAIGDGGDTALTLNLCEVKNKPKSFR